MNTKLLTIVLSLIMLFFLGTCFLGVGTTNLIMGILFLLCAGVFTFYPELFNKYIKHVNPKLFEEYNSEEGKSVRAIRKKNILSLYMLSFVMLLNSFITSASPLYGTAYTGFNYYTLLGIVVIFTVISLAVFRKKTDKKGNIISRFARFSAILGFFSLFIAVAIYIIFMMVL